MIHRVVAYSCRSCSCCSAAVQSAYSCATDRPCSFKDLMIEAAQIDELMKHPVSCHGVTAALPMGTPYG